MVNKSRTVMSGHQKRTYSTPPPHPISPYVLLIVGELQPVLSVSTPLVFVSDPVQGSPMASLVLTDSSQLTSDIQHLVGGSDDVSHARDRLKGCLQELLDHSDDSSISSQDETLGISHDLIKQMLIKKETIPPPSNIKLKLKKRRRRRDFVVDRTFHPHTFVMKLFDRSVDLAQFKENSSLYPICRAWMTNQPHNTNLMPKERSPTPEPTTDTVSGEDEGTGSESDSELVKEMYRMPAPKPLPMDDTRYTMRVPSPILREPEQEVKNETDSKGIPSKESLLTDHLKHWTVVRKKWHATAHKNENRYESSRRILKAIYKRAQKAYEQ
uniref:Protein lin-37 homolog n=1 Tax=Timema genevievae TaxID=629358 RepID=A0A7R9JYS5_TIMGE|nr:unnamed protein product [Timema genevievae]